MSQTKKPFDLESFFRKRIKTAEKAGASQSWNEPDDGLWDQIEQALPEHNPRKYRALLWFFGVALLGVIAWLSIQNRALKQEIALMAKQSSEASRDFQSSSPAAEINGADGSPRTKVNHEVTLPAETNHETTNEKIAALAGGRSQPGPSNFQDVPQTADRATSATGLEKEPIKYSIASGEGKTIQPSGLNNESESEAESDDSGQISSRITPLADKVGSREIIPVNVLASAGFNFLPPEREVQVQASLPKLQLIKPLQKREKGLELSVVYEPSFAKLKNTTQYPDAPEFRGIDDLGVWSDAFSVRLSKELKTNLSVFAGIRYGAYQYQTAYYIALPYDPLLEVEGADGNFTSDFSHSFPSPVGDMEATFGLLRLAEDAIQPQTILDFDLHARHRLKLVEVPIGISKSFNISDRVSINGSLSAIPGFVTGKESSAYAFESHHMAMHHRYSGFRGKTKSYNHLIFSGGADLTFSYQLTPHIDIFAGGGVQAGLTNVYSDLNVHSKIRAYRLLFGISNHF